MAAVGLREYGRMRNVSAEAVRKAIKSGRLAESVTYDAKGWPRIDPDIADREWGSFTHPTHGGVRGKEAPSAPPPDDDDEPIAPRQSGNAASTFAQSRAIKEAYLARLAKLEFEEKSGKLVNADGMKNEAFKLARIVRDSILNIPDRISAELAAQTDTFSVHKLLTDELRKALESLGGTNE